MALGNLVRQPLDRPAVTAIPAEIPAAERRSFWLRRRFRIPRQGRFWRWLCGLLCRGGRSGDSDCRFCRVTGSAADAMSIVTDHMRLGVEGGSETVEVAHRHVFFMSGPGGVCDPALDPGIEGRLANSLMSSLKGYFDPEAGIRAGCMANEAAAAEQAAMYLGPGVFVPRPGERPIGWVRYFPDPKNRSSFVEPLLADGRPAGIYKGQQGLAFGGGARRFPADLALGLEEETGLLIALQKAAGAKGGVEASLVVSGDRQVRPEPQLAQDAPEEADRAWRISFFGAHRPPGRLEVCADARPSRLHLNPSSRCNAAIVRLSIDLTRFGKPVDRFWIDFDRGNRLCASALQHVKTSLVWDDRDRREYAYDWGGGPAPFRAPGRIGMSVRADGDTVEIARADGRPLGYLALPDRPQQAIFADESQVLQGFHLDWLDECGRISIGGRVMPLGQAHADAGVDVTLAAFAAQGVRRGGSVTQVAGPLVIAEMVEETA